MAPQAHLYGDQTPHGDQDTHGDAATQLRVAGRQAGEVTCASSADWVSAEAELLLDAQCRRVPVRPLTARRDEVTLADAYRVQAAGVERRVVAGTRRVGHKVGLTSAAMQHQMGVSEPDSGVLLDDMIMHGCGELRVQEFLAPRVEAEIAFWMGCDLRGSDVDECTARRAVSQVGLALEVIDTRFGSWRIGLADSVADNASCARVVVGQTVALGTANDPSDERVVLSVDGVPVAHGTGRAVMGDPFAAVSWLAQRLDELGGGLRAGDLVLAGAVHASIPLRPGTEVRAHAAGLSAVHLRVR
jgi:2-keto-4-pentenoate hydratase